MRPIVLSEIFPPRVGGSGRWLWEMYSRLTSCSPVFVVGESPKAKTFDESVKQEIYRRDLRSASWGLLDPRGLLFYIKITISVWLIARRSQANIIHCARVQPEGVIALFLKLLFNLPYLCYIHGEDIEMARSSREYRWLVQRVIKNSEILICNSKNTLGLLKNNWDLPPTLRCEVIYPGVDIDRYIPKEPDHNARERLGWVGKFVLLTVSRLQERKGHDHLIAGLPELVKKFPNTIYAIVGNGPMEAKLKAKAERLGVTDSVVFYDELSEAAIIEAYQQADLFVLPNRTVGRDVEGFGIVLLEAQACGTPVLAGNSGGTRETLQDGSSGKIIETSSPEKLVSELDNILGNEKVLSLFRSNARRWIEENFSWQRVVCDLENLLSNINEQRRGGQDV